MTCGTKRFPVKARTMVLLAIVPAIIILSQAGTAAFAQQGGIVVSGRVTDEKGKPLPGTLVRLKKKKGSVPTNKKGEFTIQCGDENTIIQFSRIGYVARELLAKSVMANPVIKLKIKINNLDEVTIQRTIGTRVDLKHKGHQSLAQVLEGAIPGVAVRRGRTTTTGPLMMYSENGVQTIQEVYEERCRTIPGMKRFYPTLEVFEKDYHDGGSGESLYEDGRWSAKAEQTTNDTGFILEQRGAGGFNGQTNGMLVVIDGFVQDGVDPNLPMNNIASLEVVQDPLECLKWGPRGSNGVILITTNAPKPGQVRVSYSSNLYFSAAPDLSPEKLERASAADLLEYYQEAHDKKIASYSGADEMPFRLNLAERLLFGLDAGRLTKEEFRYKWDSLGMLSNRDQLRLLQQNSFNQNHALSLSGGTRRHLFSLGATHGRQQSKTPGSLKLSYGLNFKSTLSLFKDKVKIDWRTAIQSTNNKTVKGSSGQDLEPYQLLLGSQGEYAYDYTGFDPELNEKMLKAGYRDNGVNLLEDLRSSSRTAKSLGINSNLNLNWKIARGLSWSASLAYHRTSNSSEDLKGKESSFVRQLVNRYGSPVYDPADEEPGEVKDILFHVPFGDVLTKTRGSSTGYNIRSGFQFDRVFASAHRLAVSADAGLGSSGTESYPNAAVYGYDQKTKTGLPVIQGDPATIAENYLGASIYPGQLLVPGLKSVAINRSIALNGSLKYSYLNRYALNTNYSSLFVPNFGEDPPYAATGSCSVTGIWTVSNEPFFNIPFFNNLQLSLGTSSTQVAKLRPDQVVASLVSQPEWNNEALVVNSLNNQVQQNGQENHELSGKLLLGFSKDNLQLSLGYVRNSIGKAQWNARLMYNISGESYFRSGLVSTLRLTATLQNISAFQGLNAGMKANSLSSGNGFDAPTIASNNGLLPPSTIKKEARLRFGVFDDRYTMDLRCYSRRSAGLSNGNVPADPASGLATQIQYSIISNKGIELALNANVIKQLDFNWTVTLNAAYNINQAVEVSEPGFSLTDSYLRAQRNGYATDNLWNFRWAGLDANGDPQVYGKDMEKLGSAELGKITDANDLALVYSGRTTAPWTGGLIQQFSYKDFFASARVIFNMGHIMRDYKPVLNNTSNGNGSIAIRDRWRKAGDEAFTDIAAIAKSDPVRELMIRGSDNGVMPADNIRLAEIQLGYDFSSRLSKNKYVKGLSLSAQIQNVALWVRNKRNLDPRTVSNTGVVGPATPRNYSLSISVNF